MEVVVTFVGGDIDRPMVLGTVYNAHNPTPYALPGKKTQSGIKTRSTPGGGGANELRFEDAAGREQVYLHAQKDLDEVVENNHTRTVKGDESVVVGRSSTVDVGGDQEVSVKGNEVVTIEKNLVLHVVRRQIIHVDGQDADGEGAGVAEREEDGPHTVVEEKAGALAGPEQVFESSPLADKVASARLLFLGEMVPDQHYPTGRWFTGAADVAGAKVTELEGAARGLLAAPAPLPDLTSRAQALVTQARGIREAVGSTITSALGPVDPAVQRLQIATIQRLQELWRRADRVEKTLQQVGATGRGATLGGGSGGARGGGGGDVKPWTKTKAGEKSVLKIAKGGGLIETPDGLQVESDSLISMTTGASSLEISPSEITLKSGGSWIKITDGQITFSSPEVYISATGRLQAEGSPIDLTSRGNIIIDGKEVNVRGEPIRLN